VAMAVVVVVVCIWIFLCFVVAFSLPSLLEMRDIYQKIKWMRLSIIRFEARIRAGYRVPFPCLSRCSRCRLSLRQRERIGFPPAQEPEDTRKREFASFGLVESEILDNLLITQYGRLV